jgi:hypothetical protein
MKLPPLKNPRWVVPADEVAEAPEDFVWESDLTAFCLAVPASCCDLEGVCWNVPRDDLNAPPLRASTSGAIIAENTVTTRMAAMSLLHMLVCFIMPNHEPPYKVKK